MKIKLLILLYLIILTAIPSSALYLKHQQVKLAETLTHRGGYYPYRVAPNGYSTGEGAIIGDISREAFLSLLKENADYARTNLQMDNQNPITPKTIIIGRDPDEVEHGTNCIMIGVKTGWRTTNSNVILLGAYANTTNDYELVIRFRDGTEFRHKLPTNTIVDMRGMWNWPDEGLPEDPFKEKK